MKKVVLVTGSSQGIGANIIKKLANNNYDVVVNYNHSEKKAYELKYELDKNNINSLVIKCDITNEDEVQKMIETIIIKFHRIDVLINNASISLDSSLMEKTKEEFMSVLEVNLVGAFLVAKYALKYMNDGVIINIASTDGIDTYNPLSYDYCASKAGLINLTKNMSLEVNNNRVLAIAPNWVNSETILNMNSDYLNSEMKRIGQKKLIDMDVISSKILEIIENNNYKSGDIIEVRDGINV